MKTRDAFLFSMVGLGASWLACAEAGDAADDTGNATYEVFNAQRQRVLQVTVPLPKTKDDDDQDDDDKDVKEDQKDDNKNRKDMKMDQPPPSPSTPSGQVFNAFSTVFEGSLADEDTR